MLMAKQAMALGSIGLARIWKAHSVHVSHPYNRHPAGRNGMHQYSNQ